MESVDDPKDINEKWMTGMSFTGRANNYERAGGRADWKRGVFTKSTKRIPLSSK